MNTNGAEWHVIPGFSRYEITREGEVRNRETLRVLRGHPVRGYPAFRIERDDAQVKQPYLHTLLLITFVGPKGPGEVCRHLDGNKLNHSLDNLRWGTETENMYDLVRHGNHAMAKKTHCPKGHPYDEANTYVIASRPTARYCLICNRARARAHNAKKRFEAKNAA